MLILPGLTEPYFLLFDLGCGRVLVEFVAWFALERCYCGHVVSKNSACQTSTHQHRKKPLELPSLQRQPSFLSTTILIIGFGLHHADKLPHTPRRTTPGYPHRKLRRHNARLEQQSRDVGHNTLYTMT